MTEYFNFCFTYDRVCVKIVINIAELLWIISSIVAH